MQLIDLSHPLGADTKPYPGSRPSQIRQTAALEKNGYREKMLGLSSHLGTHVDAPAHMLSDGKTLDRFSLQQFYGRALVLDAGRHNPGEIPLSVLQDLPAEHNVDFILLYTGWCEKWGGAGYFSEFPSLSAELAADLSKMNIKGVGLDGPSVDAPESKDYKAHHLLLAAEILIIENLRNLDILKNKIFTLAVFPLSVQDADGSPVRAVAILEQEKHG